MIAIEHVDFSVGISAGRPASTMQAGWKALAELV